MALVLIIIILSRHTPAIHLAVLKYHSFLKCPQTAHPNNGTETIVKTAQEKLLSPSYPAIFTQKLVTLHQFEIISYP